MSITDVRMRSDYRLWDRIHVKPTDLNDARHVDNVVYFKWFNHTIGTCLRELGVMDFTHGKLFPFTILLLRKVDTRMFMLIAPVIDLRPFQLSGVTSCKTL